MCLDEGLGDGQAQAGPAATAILAEHLEDALAIFSGDAGPVVADGYLDERRVSGRAPPSHPDDASGGGDAFGVLEDIGQNLAHEEVVDVQEREVRRRVDLDASRRNDDAELAQCLVDQVSEVDRRRTELERARLQTGHVEEIGHEPRQAVGLQLNQLQELRLVAGGSVAHRPGAGWTRRP